MNYPTTKDLAEILVRNGVISLAQLRSESITQAAMELRHRMMATPVVTDSGYCGDCPHLRITDRTLMSATCALHHCDLEYYDGFQAVCTLPGMQKPLHSDVNTPAKPGSAVADAGTISQPTKPCQT